MALRQRANTADQRQRHALVQRGDGRPLAGALLAGGVQNLVNQRLAVGILLGKNVGGNLDQIAVEHALVPLLEHLVHFVRGHAEVIAHQLVGFADQLHIAVLDAVVNHLHEVTRAVFANPVAAGLAVHVRADGLEDGLDIRPRLGRAAGHHARALQRALFAAGNAGADVVQTLALHVRGAAGGVREVAVAAVDDDVAGFENLQKLLDHVVDGFAGLDHHHNLARLGKVMRQLLDGVAADDVLALRAAFHKVGHLGGGAVENSNGESLGFHVHNQIFAHNGEADQTDIRKLGHNSNLLLYVCRCLSASRGRCPSTRTRPALRPRGWRSPPAW